MTGNAAGWSISPIVPVMLLLPSTRMTLPASAPGAIRTCPLTVECFLILTESFFVPPINSSASVPTLAPPYGPRLESKLSTTLKSFTSIPSLTVRKRLVRPDPGDGSSEQEKLNMCGAIG